VGFAGGDVAGDGSDTILRGEVADEARGWVSVNGGSEQVDAKKVMGGW
jgi:hypothetical protein